MCGIVGIIKRDNPVDSDSVVYAANLLAKRGPDDSGVWVEEGVGFGHRRLAILDISSAAHQPMKSKDGRYVIVYNGEIYNYKELRSQISNVDNNWKSSSDTEVILASYAKWGAECLSKLKGMFAFAIWDRHKKVLFAARDRMGIKPFYYHYSPDNFVFASRPQAMFALHKGLSKEIDEQALRYYLEAGYIPAPHSIHHGIRKLPPAHYLLLDINGIRIERYWDYRRIEPDESLKSYKEEDLVDQLDEHLSQAVRSHMISDVPLGAFLSGGIDSSLIVAIMAKYSSKPVKTFTIGFEEKEYDESVYASSVAKYLGTEHHHEKMMVDDLLGLLPDFHREFDEPFFDSSSFPCMAVSRLARRYVTVSLSGDGGDELFGGYHYYGIAEKMDRIFSMPRSIRLGIASAVGILPGHRFKLLAGAMCQPDRLSSFVFSRSIAKDYPNVFLGDVKCNTQSLFDLMSSQIKEYPKGLRISEQGMRLDAFYTLPDEYLQKVDVSSMAYSLESRVPLLDHSVVEWAMKLPLSWKLRGGVNKYLLRKLAYRYVPKQLLNRPKKGFAVPIDTWLRGPLKAWAEERIYGRSLLDTLPLNYNAVDTLWKSHINGSRNVHPLLWAILMLLEFQNNFTSNATK